jgi:streptogramin lyase
MEVKVRLLSAPIPTQRGTGEIMNIWIETETFGFKAVAFRPVGGEWRLLPLGANAAEPYAMVQVDDNNRILTNFKVAPEVWDKANEIVKTM